MQAPSPSSPSINPIFLLNDTDPELPYRRRTAEEKKAIPWGQRKLFVNELLYLVHHWNPQTHPKPQVVYAGSAPGRHLPFLSSLLPEITFHLYDPAPFQIKETDKIKISQTYFTDETAKTWANRTDVFFISDIRTGDYSKMNPTENEIAIWKDMEAQQRWYEIIRPVSAMLKFRLPYPDVENLDFVKDGYVEYLDGLLYLQPWAPQTSTECRLVPNGKVRKWSISKYEAQMFHHNVTVREQTAFSLGWNDPNKELVDDYDSYYETLTFELYRKLTNRKDTVATLSEQLTRALNFGRSKEHWYRLSKLRADTFLIKRRYMPKNKANSKDNSDDN